MLVVLARSLLAMLVTPENLNAGRRGGKGEKFPSSPAKSHIYCFLLTDLHIPYFQPPGNHSANHESLFFARSGAELETKFL